MPFSRLIPSFLFTVFIFGFDISSYAFDDDSDVVAQCVAQYQHVSQSPNRVQVFCRCIVEQMPEAAKLKPIIRWIKIHPDVVDACRMVLK